MINTWSLAHINSDIRCIREEIAVSAPTASPAANLKHPTGLCSAWDIFNAKRYELGLLLVSH